MPLWWYAIALSWLGVCFGCAAYLWRDVATGDHQIMPVMRWVWPVNALYMGPLAVWAYRTMDRDKPKDEKKQDPFWKIVFKAVTHCGTGCTLGDIIGEWIVFGAALAIAGEALWPEYLLDFALAYILGIVFQYFSIAPMRGISGWQGVKAALKADTLSLAAFEMGLFGWMALARSVFYPHKLHPDAWVYWFMMAVGMMAGFLTAYPVNWWLVKVGLKEKM